MTDQNTTSDPVDERAGGGKYRPSSEAPTPPAGTSDTGAVGAAPVQPVPGYASRSLEDTPGGTLGLIALVSSFFIGIVGLILGLIALQKSHRAGEQNVMAIVAVIYSGASLAIGLVVLLFVLVNLSVIALMALLIGTIDQSALQFSG